MIGADGMKMNGKLKVEECKDFQDFSRTCHEYFQIPGLSRTCCINKFSFGVTQFSNWPAWQVGLHGKLACMNIFKLACMAGWLHDRLAA